MVKTIRKLPQLATLEKPKRVAAYARVSSGKFSMVMSLAAQTSYYSDLIQHQNGTVFVGIYADEGITGTKEDRPEFQRLMEDCRAGKIDVIYTKSTSRLARNTVLLLKTVRELKLLGVDIYFEKENIHSLSTEGELLLTILASYAQEESRSASENQLWRVRKNFENGRPWNGVVYGYRLRNGKYEIHPEEAAVVRGIFEDYLSGMGHLSIAKKLNEQQVAPMFSERWGPSSVSRILKNDLYTGNLLLQKTYRENYITKKVLPNLGELPKYFVEGAHEAIISQEMYAAVQAESSRRAERHYHPTANQKNMFTGLITCTVCGKYYRKKPNHGKSTWTCGTYITAGKQACASKAIPEDTLMKLTGEVLGMTNFTYEGLREMLTGIDAENGNRLTYRFKDGHVVVRVWEDRSRRESWTPEMREQARQRQLERKGCSDA